MIQVDALARESAHLVALPASATRLAAIFANEDWEMEEVVAAISLDPAITSRALRIANSAVFGATESITTMDRAVQRIGAGAILSLTIGVGARSTLSQPMPEYGADEGVLWRHSVASALAAELAHLVCTAKIPVEAFTAALLHDVGKLVLSRHMKPEVLELLARAQTQGGVDALHAEVEILEVHHGELGGLIAQHWGLPSIIVKGITFHHNPGDVFETREQLLCDTVCVANAAAKLCGFGLGDPEPAAKEHLESRERLGMTDAGFEELCEMLTERVEEVLSCYE